MKRSPLLVTPGPVEVPAEAFLDLPSLHHRSAAFRSILDESASWLGRLIGTSRPIAFLAASGTGGMEAAIANATRAGDRVLVVSGGKFGDRWAEIARAHGRGVSLARFPDGAALPADEAIERCRREKPDAIALTHVESSTGALAPVREIVSGLGRGGPVVLVDAISSAGAEDLRMDEWGMDAVVGASQKALGAPPGVCFVAMSERAAARSPREGLYYFDLARYYSGPGASLAPFTPAVQTIQIVHRSLSIMRKMGFDRVRARHEAAARSFVAACSVLGLRPFAEAPSSAVQALRLPPGCAADDLLDALEGRGFAAAGGQGALAGSIIRMGFLGVHDGATVAALVASLGEALRELGFEGDSEKAAREAAAFAEKEPLFGIARRAAEWPSIDP